MILLSNKKKKVLEYIDKNADKRDDWINKNNCYHRDLKNFFLFHITEGKDILEIGCGTGDLLNELKPSRGVGIDISGEMIKISRVKYPHLEFIQMDAEEITLNENFDFIIISDTLGYFEDIQKVFQELKKVVRPDTRIIITFHNFLWQPFLKLAEFLGLKMPQRKLNWLNRHDLLNLLFIENYDLIKMGNRLLFPQYIPLFSWLINKYISQIPFINKLCITGYLVVRPDICCQENDLFQSVSVVIPARNEKGNIESAILRMPRMGKNTEIIFVEGHSTDGTLEEIKRVCEKYSESHDVKFIVQDGKGKGDAVRKGFETAKGDIFMILDADLTVPPEDLPKFYSAIASGKGEFINGSRLVYPLENEAMRTLNILANKLFSIAFTFLLGQRIKDTLCGTKVISKINYEKIISNRKYFGDFDPFGDFDLIFGAAKLNLKIIEVPVSYKSREYGETNISRFRHGWMLIKMVFFAMNKIKFI